MHPLVVFLHIEKAAGSSFRSLFYQNYGNHNIFWHGINEETEISEYPLVGGHRTIEYYRKKNNLAKKPIYLAVLRDPKERVLSFYTHLRRHTNYFEEHKATDFNDAIINCQPFRDHIKAGQLSYVTGKNNVPDLELALSTEKYVIGSMENLNSFTKFISSSFGLESVILPKDNIGLPNYQSTIDVSHETDNELDILLRNDLLLHEHILACDNGLYTNVTDNNWKQLRSELEKLPKENTQFNGSFTFMKSQMPPNSLNGNTAVNINVFLKNESNSIWTHTNGVINLSYHWLSANDEMVIFEGIRTPLEQKKLKPGEAINQRMKIRTPKEKGTYKLKIVPMKTKYGWFENEKFACDTSLVEIL